MALERLPPRTIFLVDMRERLGVFLLLLFSHVRFLPLRVRQYQRRARMPHAERAAGAMHQRHLAILHLARTAFAAKLLGRLDDEKNPAHPRMVRRQPAAVGVDREIAVE